MSKISDVTNFKKFLPLHDRVLVKRLESEGKSAGGIILPESVQEKPMVAKVEAVGSGSRDNNGKIISLDVNPVISILYFFSSNSWQK